MKAIVLVTLLLYFTKGAEDKVSYYGFSVLEIIPSTDEQLNMINEMLQTIPCRQLSEKIGIGKSLDLLCDKKQAEFMKKMAQDVGLKLTDNSDNFQKDIKKDMVSQSMEKSKHKNNLQRKKAKKEKEYKVSKLKRRKHYKKQERKKKKKGKHREYMSYDDMVKFLEEIVKSNSHATLENIGSTVEKRDIKIIKINSEDSTLPIIFMDAGIHAREWIAPAATLFVIERLVKVINRKDIEHKTKLFQWHIIPMANPDGYEYSRTMDRMWRKNKAVNPGTKCLGVDLNRNFPEGYRVGASSNPCHETYMGPETFSEPEARAIRDYLDNIGGKVLIAISVHCYGNVIIYPWGYKETQHPDVEKFAKLTGTIRKAIIKKTGEEYIPGTAVEVLGKWGLAGGATDDYYSSQGIPYSFTFELPDKDDDGKHGFLLPPRNIKRVGKQLMVGLQAIARVQSRWPL